MYVQWQGMPTVETWQADKATRYASDIVVTFQKQTATVFVVGLQTMQEMQ
jgi:hypothetical protein